LNAKDDDGLGWSVRADARIPDRIAAVGNPGEAADIVIVPA
jgi:hypothetical protein